MQPFSHSLQATETQHLIPLFSVICPLQGHVQGDNLCSEIFMYAGEPGLCVNTYTEAVTARQFVLQ